LKENEKLARMSFTNVSDIIKCFVNAHETVKALCFFNKVEDSILEMSFLVCFVNGTLKSAAERL